MKGKRLFPVSLLLLVLMLFVTACGGQPATTPASNQSEQAAPSNEEAANEEATDEEATDEEATNEEATDEEATNEEATTSGGKIIVGSKDFTEQFVIGEMFAIVLEKAGFEVERKLSLGGTPVAQAAITSGEIDLYPEYTGTGLLTILKLPVNNNPEEVFESVAQGYKEQFNLMWLQPAPMNNAQALAMPRATAEQYGITTISDMVANASDLIMVGPAEFEEREDGLPGLKEIYGDFDLKEYRAVDKGLRYQGLVEGEADIAVAFGTDGEISAFDLIVLEDDMGMFPPYQVAPVVRQEILDAHPEVANILNEVTPKLTNEVMQRLNYEVSGNQREPADVAEEFLTQEGLLD